MIKSLTTVCLIVGLCAALNCSGQAKKAEERKDSYKVFRSKSRTSDVGQLLDEANDLKFSNPDEALTKVKEALGVSLAQGDDLSEAKCYLLIGEINENIDEWKLALENYNRSYAKLRDSHSSSAEYKRAILGLGKANLSLGNYQKSLQSFQEILSMRLSSGEKRERQLDISEVYYQMGNYDESLRVLENITAEKVADPSFETRLQSQKAKIYARKNELDKTKDSYENSISTIQSNKGVDKEGEQSIQNAKEEIADVLRGQKRYDDEIDLRNQSVEFNLKSKNFAEVAKDKVEIGRTLLAKGENSAALKEIEEAARIADTLNNPREQANAFLALADLYQKNGKNTQALSAYKKYSEAVIATERLNENQLLERSGLIKQQRDIEELTKDVSIGRQEETIERATVFRQQLIIYGLLFILGISGITS